MSKSKKSKETVYRIVLKMRPIPRELGAIGAKEIEEDLKQNRPYCERPVCAYDAASETMTLSGESTHDKNGDRFAEIFQNLITAHIGIYGDEMDFEPIVTYERPVKRNEAWEKMIADMERMQDEK